MLHSWRRGDQAMCVNVKPIRIGPLTYRASGLQLFQVYTVERVTSLRPMPALFLEGDDGGPAGRLMVRFIRLKPLPPDDDGRDIPRLRLSPPR